MKNKNVILLFSSVLLTGIFVYVFDAQTKKDKIITKIKDKSTLEASINLKKNKRLNSKVYKLVVEKKIDDLIQYFSKLDKSKELDAFKDLLLARQKLKELPLKSKEKFYYFLDSYQSEQKVVDVYIHRTFPYLFQAQDSQEMTLEFKRLLTGSTDEQAMTLMNELRTWARLPEFVLDFIVEKVQSKNLHYQFSALSFYAHLNDNQQIEDTYKRLQPLSLSFSEKNQSLFHKINLTKIKILKIEKGTFTALLKKQGPEWSELKLNVVESFSIVHEQRDVVRKIAKENTNAWVKQRAQNLLEKAK